MKRKINKILVRLGLSHFLQQILLTLTQSKLINYYYNENGEELQGGIGEETHKQK